MKQEFITARGKLFIDDEKLVIRNYKLKNRSDMYWMGLMALVCLYRLEKDSPIAMLNYLLLGIIGFILLLSLIEVLFIYSWKNKIRLQEIVTYKVTNDQVGLETMVTLKLRSGKQKEILFRTHEQQLQPFLELISQQTVLTQFV